MKALIWTAIMAVALSGQVVLAHGGGGGGSHGGGGGSHGSWGGGSHGSWGGGGSSHGGFHGGTFSHGGGGGGNFLHRGAGVDRGFHHGWGYGWWPWFGGWGWYGYDGLDYIPPTVVEPAVVTSAPPVYQVTGDGVTYFVSNGVMYAQTANGTFQPMNSSQVTAGNNSAAVAQPPVVSSVTASSTATAPAQPPAAGQAVANAPGAQGNTTQADEVFTVYIAKLKGGYAPVTMRRSGTGYIGPQGEYYPEFPKIDLLKAMYGK